MAKQCAGISITTTHIRVVTMSQKSSKAEVQSEMFEQKFDEPISFSDMSYKKIEEQSNVITDALEKIAKRAKLKGKRVVVAMPNDSCFCRYSSVPNIDPKRLDAIAKFEAVQQFPFSIDELDWTYHAFSDRTYFGLFGIKKDKTKIYKELIEAITNAKVVGIVPDCVALYNSLKSFGEVDNNDVILSSTDNTLDVIVKYDGKIWTRTTPLSSNTSYEKIDEEIKRTLSYCETILFGFKSHKTKVTSSIGRPKNIAIKLDCLEANGCALHGMGMAEIDGSVIKEKTFWDEIKEALPSLPKISAPNPAFVSLLTIIGIIILVIIVFFGSVGKIMTIEKERITQHDSKQTITQVWSGLSTVEQKEIADVIVSWEDLSFQERQEILKIVGHEP